MTAKLIPGGSMMLLPPKEGLCPECATDHPPEMPHNAQSLFYGVKFQMENDRSPDWRDAMAHCDEETKARWTAALIEAGVDVEGGQVNPAKGKRS